MTTDSFTPPAPLNTAVLFLVFNRLDTTKQVFAAIKQAKPPRLYIAADGARTSKEGEAEKVNAVRDFILQNIDWDCEVKTLFRKENLGCKYAVSGAIDWFFEQEEMGIILEDDCLPSQSFFWFCEELLERYKDDMRVFLVSGYNKQGEWQSDKNDYFFSNYGGIWGWASWRRAWGLYDIEMKDLTKFSEDGGFKSLLGEKQGAIRQKSIESVNEKHINTWDYQWALTRHINGALACVPAYSLIENIGFGADATHTSGENLDNVQKQNIFFPLKENNFFAPDRKYDALFLGDSSLFNRVKNKIKPYVWLKYGN